eukprot:TRINITY_DN5271_c0_g1_i2.p1 TRINITY_DN5271_c0_g1~~TRINITY_DN5271_c0_g1_i2.p1  ORF type:complete len:492 (+),score=83.87 TRINITY_DN5271_c0_g1_i2:346-1821(+)
MTLNEAKHQYCAMIGCNQPKPLAVMLSSVIPGGYVLPSWIPDKFTTSSVFKVELDNQTNADEVESLLISKVAECHIQFEHIYVLLKMLAKIDITRIIPWVLVLEKRFALTYPAFQAIIDSVLEYFPNDSSLCNDLLMEIVKFGKISKVLLGRFTYKKILKKNRYDSNKCNEWYTLYCQLGFKPDTDLLNHVLFSNNCSGNYLQCEKLFKDFKLFDILPDEDVFFNIISSFEKQGSLHDRVIGWFRVCVEEYRITPSSALISKVILLTGKYNYEFAHELLLDSMDVLSMDTTTINNIVNFYNSNRKWEEIEQYLATIEGKGYSINSSELENIAKGYYKLSKFDLAEKYEGLLMDKYPAHNRDQLNAMKYICKYEYDAAEKLIKEMEYPITITTFFIQQYFKEGKPDKGEQLLSNIPKQKWDKVLIRNMIQCYSMTHNIEKILEMIDAYAKIQKVMDYSSSNFLFDVPEILQDRVAEKLKVLYPDFISETKQL